MPKRKSSIHFSGEKPKSLDNPCLGTNAYNFSPSSMNRRQQQRQESREKILRAALEVFAHVGFDEASTHKIAREASVTQGLVAYHFHNKDELWQAVTDHIFALFREEVPPSLDENGQSSPQLARRYVRAFVRFASRYPVVLRFLIENNLSAEERLDWIVPRHVQPGFAVFSRHFTHVAEADLPYMFRAFVGSAALVYATAEGFQRLHGIDPFEESQIERHTTLMTALFLPKSG